MPETLEYRTLRGIWPDQPIMNFSEQSRILCILGLVKSLEEKLTSLGKRAPADVGTGDNAQSSSDIGQITVENGESGLSETIQILWPDESRTSINLRDEIQWLVFKGFQALKDDWLDAETIWEKLLLYSNHEQVKADR